MNEQPESKKPDVVLSDGKEIVFDKKNIKRREWQSLFNPEQDDSEGNAILARFCGVTAEYITDLSLHDWQLLLKTAAEVVRRPIDPN